MKKAQPQQHIFGPVRSRRLGASLGIDLFQEKTCPLNCIFCECGPTINATLERKEFVPLQEVLCELDSVLAKLSKEQLDYITFSGKGEPLLYSRIKDIVQHIKRNYLQYPVCLLTNSLLLTTKGIFDELKDIDLIIPSLNTAKQKTFERLNRPINGITIDSIIDALAAFRKAFSNQIWLEVFIAEGINDNEEEASLLSEAIHRIKPDKVQLNTLARPGAEGWVRPASLAALNEFAAALKYPSVEIISHQMPVKGNYLNKSSIDEIEHIIIEMVKRRPSTISDIACALRTDEETARACLSKLIERGSLKSTTFNGTPFYMPVSID